MSKLKSIAILVTAFVLLAALLLSNFASMPLLAQGRGDGGGDTTSDTGGGGGGGDGGDGSSGGSFGEIRGVVTNLTTGQPAGGIEVSVNGAIVRTDASGKWSITGLAPGSYTVALQAPSGFTSAQGPQTVGVSAGGVAIVDLQFFSGAAPAPAPTAVPTAEPAAVTAPAAPSPESPPELPDAGGVFPDEGFPVAEVPLLVADAQTVLPLSDAQNLIVPTVSRVLLPAVLCNNVYVVEGGDVLAKIADFFLGSTSAYPRIVDATNASRVENPSFAEITNPNYIKPGNQLCIPAK